MLGAYIQLICIVERNRLTTERSSTVVGRGQVEFTDRYRQHRSWLVSALVALT